MSEYPVEASSRGSTHSIVPRREVFMLEVAEALAEGEMPQIVAVSTDALERAFPDGRPDPHWFSMLVSTTNTLATDFLLQSLQVSARNPRVWRGRLITTRGKEVMYITITSEYPYVVEEES